uniref:Uncharacterized protein n=1 Tax=Lepeophtheirus salmonis TaxID=72036 RepID=A0A0K2U1I7_LEPSM
MTSKWFSCRERKSYNTSMMIQFFCFTVLRGTKFMYPLKIRLFLEYLLLPSITEAIKYVHRYFRIYLYLTLTENIKFVDKLFNRSLIHVCGSLF